MQGSVASGTGVAAIGNTEALISVRNNGSEKVTIYGNGDINVTGVYKVDGTQVVGNQGLAVANATSTSDIVAQFNTLLSRVRTHGLIAT